MNDPREDPAAIVRAAERSAAALRERNRRMGWPLVIWRDGRVQHVDPMTLQPIAWPQTVRDGEVPPLPPTF